MRSSSSALVAATNTTLRDAAVAFAKSGDPADWIGAAYPIVTKTAEQRCRNTHVDPDAILSAFLDERLFAPGLVKGVAHADNPVGYLKSAVGRFVLDELRAVGPAFVSAEDLELASEREESEDAEADERDEALASLDELPMRDRILVLAQFAGLGALRDRERDWIAERRGVARQTVDLEIEAETARVEAAQEVGRARLAKCEEAIGYRKARLHKAWKSYQVGPTPEQAEAIERLTARLDADQARATHLLDKLADPFCGKPDRGMIASIIGEAEDRGDLPAATNTAWTRARRLRERIAAHARR